MITFKIRRIIALIFAIVDIVIAFFLHGTEFGVLILILSVLMLWQIWSKKFFGKLGSTRMLYDKWPRLYEARVEVVGWIFLCAILFFSLIASNS